MENAAGTAVVLVHGLWMNGMESWLLRHRLAAAGFTPAVFSYPSMHATMDQAADSLAAMVSASAAPVHLVGHSLGGLVILEALQRHPGLPDGRVVLLGSPVRGSRAARAIANWSIGPQLLGELAAGGLAGSREVRWRHPRALGVLSGSMAAGLGRMVAELPADNDGTVAVDETRIAGATDHVILHVSHTGMMLSGEVAEAVASFLHSGRFGEQLRRDR